MTRYRLRTHRDLIATIMGLWRVLPAVGAGVVGVSAIGTIAGALYLQAYFESMHTAWAIELVPYSAMLRTGLMGGAVLALATTATLALTVGAAIRLPGLKRGFLFSGAVGGLLSALRQFAPGLFQSELGRLADLGIVIAFSYAFGFTITAMVARRITEARDVRRLALAGLLLGVALVMTPLQRGQLEANATMAGGPSNGHPDVCIRDDEKPWRLVRTFDDEVLVARPYEQYAGVTRLISHADISEIRGPESSSGRCLPRTSPHT